MGEILFLVCERNSPSSDPKYLFIGILPSNGRPKAPAPCRTISFFRNALFTFFGLFLLFSSVRTLTFNLHPYQTRNAKLLSSGRTDKINKKESSSSTSQEILRKQKEGNNSGRTCLLSYPKRKGNNASRDVRSLCHPCKCREALLTN